MAETNLNIDYIDPYEDPEGAGFNRAYDTSKNSLVETNSGEAYNPDFDDPYEAPNFSPDQFYDKDEGFWSEHTGRMSAATLGAIKGYQKTPGPWWLKTGGAVIGAGVGGFIGEGASQTYKTATDSVFAPKNIAEALDKSFQAGGEEAVYELAGGLFFKVGQWGYRWYKTPTGEIVKHNVDNAQEILSSQIATRDYPEYGIKLGDTIPGNLTVSQRTQSRFLDTIETMVEKSWGGGRISRQLEINDIAIKEYTERYINTFDGTAKELLTDHGLGQLFLNSVEIGKRAHSKIGGELFKDLDNLYKPTYKTKEVVSQTAESGGNMLGKWTSKKVQQEVMPVSSDSLKKIAAEIKALTDPTKGVTLGDWGGNLLKKIDEFDATMSFAAAQEFRSGMLAELRAAKEGAKLGEGKAPMLINKLAKAMDDAIEEAAKNTGNKEFYAQYQKANKFWKTGKEHLSNKFMAKLLSTDASQIGKTVFNGTREDVYRARKALRMAQTMANKNGTKFSFDETWKKMQQGYMSDLLKNTSIKSDTGEIVTKNLDEWLAKGTDKNKSLIAAFNKNQVKSLNGFNQAMKVAQKRPAGDGAFLVKIIQGSLIIGGPAMMFAPDEWSASAETGLGTLGGVTILPNVLSRLLVNPKYARLLTAVIRSSGNKEMGARATSAMMRLTAAVGDVELELGINKE